MRQNKRVAVATIPLATTAMHPSQAWRDGYNDGVRGRIFPTFDYPEGSHSALSYWDGHNVGSVKRREVERRLGLIS